MTIEQIELRKILTQMLADNGINRETIKDFTKQIIEEKVEKSIRDIVNQTSGVDMNKSIERSVGKFVDREVDSIARGEIRRKINNCFGDISVTVKLTDPSGRLKSEQTTSF